MNVLAAAKRMVNKALGRRGHVIARISAVPSFDWLVELIGRHGLAPRTIFDVGVAYGTPWLYEAYPRAKYFLIEPTRESLPHMQRWAQRLDAEIIAVALGGEEGQIEIDVPPAIDGASVLREVGPYQSMTRYPVPVRRFDQVVDGFERPALCKIDVQGAELTVLRGMGDRLREIDVLIVETSLIATLHQGPEFADVVAQLSAVGFVLYDVIALNRRPLDRALAQMDAVFVPRDSPLRQDRRWKAG